MVVGNILGRMENGMKVIGKIIKCTVMDIFLTQTVIPMTETFIRIEFMAKDFYEGLMAKFTMVILPLIV